MCRLGARFVAGEIAYFPGWMAPQLDDESDEIGRHLGRLAELGLLTLASQPARPDQRAFVAAFAWGQQAARLSEYHGELCVRVFGVGDVPYADPEPVSRADGRFHAFAGHNARREEIECFEDDLAPEALLVLRAASYVSAFDPVWNRQELLWTDLVRILEPN